MRVLVCGGRKYNDYYKMNSVLLEYLGEGGTLIHGCAKGADRLAEAVFNDFPPEIEGYIERYPAMWTLHGNKAGYLRNKQMLEEGKPDIVIAFPGAKGV